MRRTRPATCGIHTCDKYGQKPRWGLRIHNLLRHFGK